MPASSVKTGAEYAPVAWLVQDLLPHRPPMVFIDEVESFDAATGQIAVRATMAPGKPFFSHGGVPAWTAIEFMAQAAACLVGAVEKTANRGAVSRPGVLLGTRRMELRTDMFTAGRTYRITAHSGFTDATMAAFECEMREEGVPDDAPPCAEATITAYRPPDMNAFLTERRGE